MPESRIARYISASKRRNALTSSLLALWCLSTLACAVGQTYDYRTALKGLPLTGTSSIAVEVVDQRPYVLSGDKPASFVGLQRGGYGNPFDVRTRSGAPLAEELKAAIESALQTRGYTLVEDAGAADRRLELLVREWKTDVMARMRVLYDLELNVYAGDRLLATNAQAGEDASGAGAFTHQNSANAASAFEVRFSQLLRDQQIQAALLSKG